MDFEQTLLNGGTQIGKLLQFARQLGSFNPFGLYIQKLQFPLLCYSKFVKYQEILNVYRLAKEFSRFLLRLNST
jgi:hypothetical protein